LGCYVFYKVVEIYGGNKRGEELHEKAVAGEGALRKVTIFPNRGNWKWPQELSSGFRGYFSSGPNEEENMINFAVIFCAVFSKWQSIKNSMRNC
jgi:hypothetical protein